jgi:hypothetical protein
MPSLKRVVRYMYCASLCATSLPRTSASGLNGGLKTASLIAPRPSYTIILCVSLRMKSTALEEPRIAGL